MFHSTAHNFVCLFVLGFYFGPQVVISMSSFFRLYWRVYIKSTFQEVNVNTPQQLFTAQGDFSAGVLSEEH